MVDNSKWYFWNQGNSVFDSSVDNILVDKNGVVHISDVPPGEVEPDDNPSPPGPKVELYTTSWCYYCKK